MEQEYKRQLPLDEDEKELLKRVIFQNHTGLLSCFSGAVMLPFADAQSLTICQIQDEQ